MAKTVTYERFQSPKKVAAMFGKTPEAIQRWCRLGKITHFEQIGEHYIIDVYSEWPNLFTPEIEAEKKAKQKA